MAEKKACFVLDLCSDSVESRYLWKHAWLTLADPIKLDLKKEGISIMQDAKTDDPVVVIEHKADKSYKCDIIRTIFNKHVRLLDTKAIYLKQPNLLTSGDFKLFFEKNTKDNIEFYTDNANHGMWVVGNSKIVDDISRRFSNAMNEGCMSVKSETLYKPTEKTECAENPIFLYLTLEELAVMWMRDLFGMDCLQKDNVCKQFHCFNVQISVPDMQTKVRVEEEIRNKISSMYPSGLFSNPLKLSPRVYNFLLTDEVHKYINSKVINKSYLNCVWFQTEQNTVLVFAHSQRMAEFYCKDIQAAIKEERKEVPWRYFITEDAKRKVSDLQTKWRGMLSIEIDSSFSVLDVVYTGGIQTPVSDIKNMFSVKTLEIDYRDQENCKLMFNKRRNDIEHVEELYCVNIYEVTKTTNYGWIIKGQDSMVWSAYSDLKKISQSFKSMTNTYLSDKSVDVVKSCISDINHSSPYHVSIHTTSMNTSSKANPMDLRQKIPFQKLVMMNGTTVAVYQSTLQLHTWLRKDCLVVCVLPLTEKTCSNLKVSESDDKQYWQAVMHLPVWNGGSNQEKEHLRSVLNELLDFAMETVCDKFKSLSFDLTEVIKVKWPPNKYLKEILASIQKKKMPSLSFHVHQANYEHASPIILEWCKVVSEKMQPNVGIQVLKGELAKQKSDVIVNSTSSNLQLDQGYVSDSLLRAAGNEMQFECNRYLSSKQKQLIDYNEVVVTKGYNLSCHYVFHGALPRFKDDKKQNFENFIRNCLLMALELKMNSIAFPALGTGNLGYPLPVAASKMFTVVEQFIMNQPTGTLKEVNFVIFPTNDQVIEEFEKQQRMRKQKELRWENSIVSNPQFTVFDISVVGDKESIDSTFKEIENRLQSIEETVKEETLAMPLPINPTLHIMEPQGQSIQRDERTSNSNNEVVDKTRLPEDSSARHTTHEVSSNEVFYIEIQAVENAITDPTSLHSMFEKYSILENQVVWNPNEPLRARIKLKSETEAHHLVKRMQHETNYIIQKSTPDAVVNIRAKLNNDIKTILQQQQMCLLLKQQSGVGIEEIEGETIILTGDLMALSTARDILLKWKNTNYTENAQIMQNRSQFVKLDIANNLSNPSEKVVNKVQNISETTLIDKTKGAIPKQTKHLQQEISGNDNVHVNNKQQISNADAGHLYPNLQDTDTKYNANYGADETILNKNKSEFRKQHDFKHGDSQYDMPNQYKNTPQQNKPHDLRRRFMPNEDSFIMVTEEGIKVFVYKADICYLYTDCIVNSSNERMKHEHGLSAAISKEAGIDLDDECRKYIEMNGCLQEGRVCATTAGNLGHYKQVLHVKAPIWHQNTDKKQFSRALSLAVRVCLEEAEKKHMKSVALPAISSGYGNAPKKSRFKAYPKGVLDFSKKKTTLTEIHFVDIDQDVVDHITAAFLYAATDADGKLQEKIKKIPQAIKELFTSHIRCKDQVGKHLELQLPHGNMVLVVCDGGLAGTLKHQHIKKFIDTIGCPAFKIEDTAVVITEHENKSEKGKSKSAKIYLDRSGDKFKKLYIRSQEEKKTRNVFTLLGDEKLDYHYVICSVLPRFSKAADVKNSPEQKTFLSRIDECLRNVLIESDQFHVKHLSMPILCADFYDSPPEWLLKYCVSNMVKVIKTFAQRRVQKDYLIVHIVTNSKEELFDMIHKEMSKEPLMESSV